jgi:fatty acyl-CoA reductase
MHRTTRASTIMADLSESTLPSIVDFYAHKDVLITGSTGFLGKCLLEKILRSVPDLGSVFVLTRTKRGKSPEQRTKDLLMGPVRLYKYM